MLARKQELVLAAVVAGMAIFTLLVWIPNDVSSGLIESFRHQTLIGDAFIPTLSAAVILASAVAHFVTSFLRRTDDAGVEPSASDIVSVVTGPSLRLFGMVTIVVAASLIAMFWAGPLVTWLLSLMSAKPFTYHQVHQIAPWKYIGFALGGFIQLLGIISIVEGRISRSRVLISLVAVVAVILAFGVAFSDILLPPNGDW